MLAHMRVAPTRSNVGRRRFVSPFISPRSALRPSFILRESPKRPRILRQALSSAASSRTNPADAGNEGVRLTFQNLQWHDACVEHHVVEFLEREFAAERGFRFLSQVKNFELADHVGTCLTGVGDVAFDLGGAHAVIDRLLSCPMFCVKSGIDNEPPGAKLLIKELSQQAFEVVVVPSLLGGQVLGVEPPPLDACGNTPEDVKSTKC